MRFYGQLAVRDGAAVPARGRGLRPRAAGRARRRDGAGPRPRPLLDLFLQVDREPESPEQEERLRGVRRAQVQLATFFLARGDEPHARRIFEDMKDERPRAARRRARRAG